MSTTGRAAKQRFDVADVKLNEEEMISAQDEVGRLLVLGGIDDALAGGVGQGDAGDSSAASATDSDGSSPHAPETAPAPNGVGEEGAAGLGEDTT
jgi:hypothetical protein